MTKEPLRRKGMSRSSASWPMRVLPSTFSLAIREPGLASYPAWTMALLALEVPVHTSSSLSMTRILASYRDSSLAQEQPDTPAPMIRMSYIRIFPFQE